MMWVLAGWILLVSGPGWAPPVPASDTSAHAAPAARRTPPPPSTRHTVRIGGGYQPGPGAQFLASYQYAGGPSGVWDLTAGWSEALFGHLGYTHTWTTDVWPARRWTLSGTLFSQYTPDRQLAHDATDERRTGGRLRLARITTGPWQHRQYAALAQTRLHLDRADGPNAFRDLSTVTLGAEWSRTGRFRLPVPALLIGTRVQGGWVHAAASGFVTARLRGRRYRPLGADGWAVVADGQARWASAATPAFEQAALGGTSSVRGYRTDTAISRALGTLQQELWAPLPGTAHATARVGRWLHRHVRLAAFFDVGATALSTDGRAVRTGLGMGVRLIFGPVTIRADWGHRTPDVVDGTLRGDLFLSVQPNLALGVFE